MCTTNRHPGPNDRNKTQTPDTNHWVSLGTKIDMLLLMLTYPQNNNGAGLQINDTSLPKGGKFEVNGAGWTLADHKTHRRGIDVDMRLTDTQGQRVLPDLQAIKVCRP